MGEMIALPLMIAGTVLSAAGQVQAGEAAYAQAKAQQQALDYQAEQHRRQAGQERAAGQRALEAERRRERLVQSNLLARAAASGAGASDPTIVALQGQIAAEGELRALSALYEGEARAYDLEEQARLRVFEGQQTRAAGKMARDSYRFGAFTTLVGGIGSTLYDRYGGDDPAKSEPEPKPSGFLGYGYSARRAGAYG